MAFYGTSATGAGWIVPKKYVEQVGDDGFKKAPIGAGPFKFVSFQPGVELDRKKREGQLHQIQKLVAEHVLVAPIFQQGFIRGVGSRVEQPAAGLIQGYAYVGPPEDPKLK